MKSIETPIRPGRALLHPVWLLSLSVLVLNDHVLKGSGWLPSLVTGKLSDFAGLLVAPPLLAALLRVRGRAGWWLAHLAVGSVFAAIQLSVPAADAWSSWMAVFGMPWSITSDRTDLVALPVLALSLMVYPRLASTLRERKLAEASAGILGLWGCIATSPAEEEEGGFLTKAYLHNGSGVPIIVHLRPVRAEVELDCERIASDPGAYLIGPITDPGVTIEVLPDQNVPIAENVPSPLGNFGCAVYRMEIDRVTPTLLFWQPSELEWVEIAQEGLDPSTSGWIEIAFDAGVGVVSSNPQIAFPVAPVAPPDGVCGPQSDAVRLAWDADVPVGVHRLASVNVGVDGCILMDLETDAATVRRWPLCLSAGAFPFEEGALVDFTHTTESILIRALDEETQDPAPQGPALGVFVGSREYSFQGATMSPAPTPGCALHLDPCGTVAATASVAWRHGQDQRLLAVHPAVPQTIAVQDGGEYSIYVVHAEDRVVLDPTCAEGADELGWDVEIVAVWRDPDVLM